MIDYLSFVVTAFVSNFPARTCIQVAKLPLNALVEIEAIAFVGDVNSESNAHHFNDEVLNIHMTSKL